jgi:hypothetical protein
MGERSLPVNGDRPQSDPHARARMMIALSGLEVRSASSTARPEESWLAAHLESCASCQEFREHTVAAIRSMRGIPVMASAHLVSTTQKQVRRRAAELQSRQERVWMICVCVTAVTLSTVLTTVAVWHGLAWISQQARVSAALWQSSFLVVSLMPALLAGILLLARGTFLADHAP